ncbi:MAG: zf-HC2 domain-containing protein [Clostridia bacterium]|nr:zf-HC2 domain-containing protein [Clostridia bacterium]
MSCRYNDKHLIKYSEGTLEPDEKSRFEKHLEECQSCSEKVKLLKGLAWESKASPDLNTDLTLKIKRRLSDIKPASRHSIMGFIRHNRRMLTTGAYALSLVLLLVLVWSPLSRGISSILSNKLSQNPASSPITAGASETDRESAPAIAPPLPDTKESYTLGLFRSTMTYKEILALSGRADPNLATYEEIPFSNIVVEEEPFLTENDIESFNPDTMVLKLKPGVYDRILKAFVSASPIPFVAKIDGKELFWGVTLHPISSMMPPESIPRLDWTLDENNADALKLSNMTNVLTLDDSIIMKILKDRGKLAETEQPNTSYAIKASKTGVPEFINLLKEKAPKLSKGFEAEKTYNITPDEVLKFTGCSIFKSVDTCESLLLYNNEIYPLGTGFGGLGLTDIKTCDFDHNGQRDLIYTFSWGSGLHRSEVGYFNLTTKKEIVLKYGEAGAYLNYDMLLEKASDDSFSLYHADVDITGGSFVSFRLIKGKHLANVVLEDNGIKVNLVSGDSVGSENQNNGASSNEEFLTLTNLNTADNSTAVLPLPKGWRAVRTDYPLAKDFTFNSEKNRPVMTLQSFRLFFVDKLQDTIYWENKGDLSGELQISGYYPDEPHGAVLPNHSSIVGTPIEGKSALGNVTIYLLDCDIPKDMQTEEQQTFKLYYAVIPIEGENLAYVLSLAVPLDMQPSDFLTHVKQILGMN